MVDIGINIQLTGDLEGPVMRSIQAVVAAASQALTEEAIQIQAASMEIVPVGRTGFLRASALEVGVNHERSADSVSVVIGYGGAASKYALLQHETGPDIFTHAPGRSWKYLEQPTYAAAEGMGARLAARISSAVAGTGGGSGDTFGGES